MSDAPEASERALRSLQDEGSGSSRTPLLSAKIERSLSPPLRPSSPDLTCAICLGEITDKSVTDSCFHRFCFTCLSEWSKVKPECPLCKARFTAIYHGIKSMNDFQVYRLDHSRNLTQPLDSLDAAAAAAAALDPHIFINVAVQRAFTGRFGYRTTMGLNTRTRGPSGHFVWGPTAGHDVMGPVPVSLPHPPSSGPIRVSQLSSYPSQSSSAANSSSSSRRTAARHQGIEFRKNVYRQNLWARPIDQTRIRESNPEFYRANLAQTHRLVPWLARELGALSDIGTGFRFEMACRDILQWIRTYPINSAEFKRNLSIYLGSQTDHFVHEFHQFAISPYDMLGYDMQTRYTPSTAELAATQTVSDGDDDDMEIDNELPMLPFNLSVHDPIAPLRACIGPIGRPTRNISGRPRGFSGHTLANFDLPSYLFPNPRLMNSDPPEPSPLPDVIILSSSDENEANESADSDSEVQIIGSLPPLHLRPPEQVIDLDDSNDSDVIEIKAPSPPLIEIDDDNDDSQSPPAPSVSNDVPGPSGMQRAEGHLTRSSARFFRPSYREYSSSSDDEVLSPKKKSSKKKASGSKSTTRASKRSQAPKSSKFVESSSDESDISVQDKKEVIDRQVSRKGLHKEARKRKKSKDHRASHSRREQDSEGSGVSKKHTSLPSKILAYKKSRKSKIDDCNRCGKKRRSRSSSNPSVTVGSSPEQSRTKHQKRKRRKNSECVTSDDGSSPPRRRKRTKGRHDLSSSSTTSQELDHSQSSLSSGFNGNAYVNVEGPNLARNPKALSKKAMILQKRAAETSSHDGPPAYRYGEMVELRSPTYYSMVLDNQVDYTEKAKDSLETAEDSDTSSSTTLSMGTESAPPRHFEGLPESLPPSFSPLLSGPHSPSYNSLASSVCAVANGSPPRLNNLTPPSPSYSPAKLTLKSDSIPSGPPSIASPSSDSSSTRSTVNSPAPHSSNSWPELSASQPVPDVQNQSETQPPSSPPNLRRFDDSPIITLENSPLMSPPDDSSLWNSSSESPSSSPPRLRSIVTRVPSPPRSSPQVSRTNSDNSTSDEED